MSLLEELYRETIMQHAQRPHNFGPLEGATVKVGGHNPSCGDRIELYLKVEDGRIAEARFTGHGCAISQSSASMMTDLIRGKTLDEALELEKKFKAMVVEGEPPAPELGDLSALQGVAKLHARVKCATLAWNALEQAIEEVRPS
ncbi:Fe-S cluster assembly sulfur transfer protein SufU [Oceanithermus profundus]|uniref:SUF system FeS assembly protein, NifU family n=1 Tax=Oceanithermus profundus (strain DSM 14977 / NBRC 100410 / VKM B-2274 / 506) TaxID=670487 RepID=E4U941_OCEP5|nr:SUF system NifU family Fe-S cluster assembly protein [Oceanithermus profundus]ADR36871.1 SUF system FeS assembly protein, NifU family [Oceanithermus profundus DSM 14977]